MNNKLKRYRQLSIIDSFSLNKRRKINRTTLQENMDCQNQSDNILPENTEKKMSALNLDGVINSVCQAADRTNLYENIDCQNTSENTDKKMSSLNVDGVINSVCQAAENSIDVKSENDEVNEETSGVNMETNEPCNSKNNFSNSADLFPEESPSLEDYSVQSSSHSDDLFADSDNESSENAATSETIDSAELDLLSCLNRAPDCSLPLPKLEPLENHTILFSIHISLGNAPLPYPKSYRDKWGPDHVRMPCSPLNRYPVADSMGERHIESRWNVICQSLRSDIGSSEDLEAAIMKYNSQYIGRWNFLGLHDFINQHLTEGEREHFFEVILPVMIEMALDLPNICTQPIPLLKKGKDHLVTISQKQIGCLLLNAFFCTYPRRTLPHKRHRERWTCEFGMYPDINFNKLFCGTKKGVPARNAEKLKCLFNYFRRITSEEPTGAVTFHRQSLRYKDFPKWHTSTRGIRTAVIKSSGFIETGGHGMLQVDFANKFVGGGVTGQGCVQEEIRFIICPELIVSRLFTEVLDNNEVLIITGVEQYSKYSGYGDTFKWAGNFKDETPRDSWGRRHTQVVAMDATSFKNPDVQFKLQFIERELNKAYCAFYENALPAHLPAVATGNWGCGAFKGNPNLKFLIQLMASSQTGRSLLYFTFGNKRLKKELHDMYEFLCEKNLSVGDVWRLLMHCDENVSLYNEAKYSNLFDYIYAQFLTKEENCRNQDQELTLDDSDKRAAQALIDEVTRDGSSTETEDGT